MKIKSLLFFLSALASTPCVFADVKVQEHKSLGELVEMSYSKSAIKSGLMENISADELKQKEMKSMAMSVGAQNGYVSRMNSLKVELDSKKDQLDQIWDFSVIMKLSGGKLEEIYLLPPVISITKNLTTVSDESDRIRISGTMYKIDKPARLVTVAPNWRQYLLYDQPIEIIRPVANLLPKTPSEKKLWAEWVNDGWVAGNMQAEREMTYRVRKLGADFNGMARYMTLALEGKVTKPVVSSSAQKVDGGGTVMRVDDRIVQLSMPASLNPDDNDWASLILDSRESIRYPAEKEYLNNK